MWIQVRQGAEIENPRYYQACEIDRLRDLLTSGSSAEKDPMREHFYELEHKGDAYYIYISPISGNVVLVARWVRECQSCCLAAAES